MIKIKKISFQAFIDFMTHCGFPLILLWNVGLFFITQWTGSEGLMLYSFATVLLILGFIK